MSITRNTISNLVFTLTKSFSGLILIPLFVGQVGKENYGIIVLLLGLVGYAELFDLGLKPALVRNLTAEKNDENAENKIFITALVGSFIYFIVSAIFLISAIWFFGVKFGIPAEVVKSPIIYLFVTFYFLINIVSPIFSALLISHNRFDLVNYRASFFSILGILLTLLLVWLTNLSYYAWMIATLLSKTMELAVLFFLSQKFFPNLKFNFTFYSYTKLKHLLTFGSKQLVAKWNKKIKFDSDPLILSYFLGPASLAIYRPGSAIIQSIRPIISSMAGQLFVSASKAHRDQNKEKLRLLLVTGSKFTVLAYLPLFFTFYFYGESLISLWLKTAYSIEDIHSIYQILILWSFIDLFLYVEGSSYSVLFGINHLDLIIKIDLVISILNILCSIVLVKYFNFGVLGVLLPSIATEFFVKIGLFIYTAQKIGITLGDCLNNYFVPLLSVFTIIFTALWASHQLNLSLCFEVLIFITITICLYPTLAWKFTLSSEERKLFLIKLGHYIPFVS
jgi:O-antigen/teichoic acid export membrane protein